MPDLSQYFPITDPTIIFFVVLLIILFAAHIVKHEGLAQTIAKKVKHK